jgi:adenylate cyclase, class 2
MDVQLNREIKTYCPDFAPVRQLLHELGASFIEVKEQVDFFYHLPVIGGEEGTRRLKLRVENGTRHLIYYYDRQETGVRTSRFQLWEVRDPQVKDMLEAALGIRAIVRKQRELWRKENVIFNLDAVEDVGQVFEVEALAEDDHNVEAQVEEYRRCFGPYLGPYIISSNEDLVPATA